MNNIKALSEWLGSLQITEEALSKDEWTNTEMSSVLVLVAIGVSENVQAGILENMVPDPGWFDSDQMEFKD